MNTKSKATHGHLTIVRARGVGNLYLGWVSGEFEPDLSCLPDGIYVL